MGDLIYDETVQGEGGPQVEEIYLATSFTEGPGYMKRQYLNVMGVVTRVGSSTYFLKITACGQWDELKASTRHGDKCDSPTCCRVFQIKLQELFRDLRSGAVFGAPAYIIYVIEMQMRGLPHTHIAFWVANDGPTHDRDIDRVIRTDVPGPEEAGGELRRLVLKYVVHGPCGTGVHRNPPCLDDKKKLCQKFYPKPHTRTTHTDDRGFEHYKRDHKNIVTNPQTHREVRDGWVVPYNALLLFTCKCRINLEISLTRRVVKYQFKYLYKGGSLQNVRIRPLHQQIDEPEENATCRN